MAEESREVAVRDADFSDIAVMGNGEGALPIGMEGMMVVFEEIRDNTATLVELVAQAIQPDSGDVADETAESLREADVTKPPPADTDDDGGSGMWDNAKNLASKPSMKFALLMGGLALLMAFADKLKEPLAKVLKFIKEEVWPRAVAVFQKVLDGATWVFENALKPLGTWIKDSVWPNAVDLFMDVLDKVKDLFSSVGDKLKLIFDPETSALEKVKALVGIFTDFGSFLWGIGNSIVTNVLEMFGVNFAPYDSAGAWILGKLTDMWEGVKTWFSELGTGFMEGFTGVWDWMKQKVDGIWTGVTTWFSETGTFLLDGATGIWSWMKGAIAPVWDFIKDLFTWPDSPEGFVTKLIDIILLPYNLAINFLRGIFGWGEKNEEGQLEKFSLGDFVVGKVKEMWEWIKEKFTFDIPKLDLPRLPNFGDMIKGIVGSMLPDVDSWLGKALYKFFPDLLEFKTAPSSPDIDVSMEGDTGKVENMQNVWSDEVKANAAEMKRLEGMDDDTMLPDGHSVESKKFALEMRNAELNQLIDPAKITKPDNANELANVKKEQLGLSPGHPSNTIIAPVSNTDNSVKDESTQIIPLAQEHEDVAVQYFKPGRRGLSMRGH